MLFLLFSPACGCELLGVVNNNTECHQETGNCDCLDLVTGRQCNVCVNKYYGLLLEESPGTCKGRFNISVLS